MKISGEMIQFILILSALAFMSASTLFILEKDKSKDDK